MQPATSAWFRFVAGAVFNIALLPAALGAQSVAPGIAAPHGEHGKITHANGQDFIACEYVAAPGSPHTPAVFKVFRPRPDPPAGLPKLVSKRATSARGFSSEKARSCRRQLPEWRWHLLGRGSPDAQTRRYAAAEEPAQQAEGAQALVDSEMGSGAVRAKQAQQNSPSQQLLDLDEQVLMNQGRAMVMAQQKFGRGSSPTRIAHRYEEWKEQRARDCTPPRSNRADLSSTNPAIINCLMAKTRERNARYLKAIGELEAGNLAMETATAIGLK